jgi:hypothetical protein
MSEAELVDEIASVFMLVTGDDSHDGFTEFEVFNCSIPVAGRPVVS